ncbi:MAG: Gfo/Idh/MocA family oxidoreductase [Ruminococcaceae bacterium]|nr:Gfo/Idh/MocA family oxidoreductase [Oscillospiraceae bacterium]
MKKLKIVQIGIGHDHAPAAFRSMQKQTDIFELVGWAPVGDEADRPIMDVYKSAPRLSPEEALNIPGLDAVCIETDDWNLTEWALKAVERDLPVEMDKPGTPDHGEFEQLCREAHRRNVPLQVGYMYRHNPFIRQLINDVCAGELGTLHAVEAHMDCIHTPEKRQWLDHFPGGMLYYLGCYLIDLVVQLQGVPQEIIPMSVCSKLDGVTSLDIGMAAMRYENGLSFVKTSANEMGGFLRRQLVVCGTKKTVELRPLEEDCVGGLQLTRRRICSPPGWNDGVYDASEAFDRYDGMFAFFAKMARGVAVNPYTLAYEEQLHRIILAACGVEIDYKKEFIL